MRNYVSKDTVANAVIGGTGCLIGVALVLFPAIVFTLAWNELLVSFFPTIRNINLLEGALMWWVVALIFRPFRATRRS